MLIVLASVGGAVVVALIAAWTAQSRLRQQLTHDRVMRDLDELRGLLDQCAQAGSRSAHAFGRYGLLLGDAAPPALVAVFWRGEGTPEPEAARYIMAGAPDDVEGIAPKSPKDAVMDLHREMAPIRELYQRVVLRLGVDHPVSASVLDLQMALTHAIFVMDADLDTDHVPADLATLWARTFLAVRQAHFGFLSRAREAVGSRVQDTPSQRVARLSIRAWRARQSTN